MLDQFDRQAIISAQDRDLLYHPQRDEVEVIPNGVDTEFFSPAFLHTTRPHEAPKYDLLFTGNMNYRLTSTAFCTWYTASCHWCKPSDPAPRYS